MKKTKAWRKRSAAAKKGWVTRRAIQQAILDAETEEKRVVVARRRKKQAKIIEAKARKPRKPIKLETPPAVEKRKKVKPEIKYVEVIPPVKVLPLVETVLPEERKLKVPRDVAMSVFDFEADDLEREMKKAVVKLTSYNYSAAYRFHTTRDMIIDADLVIDIRPEMDLDEAALALIRFCPKPASFFLCVGFILPHPDFESKTGQVLSKKGKVIRRRREGKGDVRTTSTYFSASTSKTALIKTYAEIHFNLDNKGHKKPVQIFMRVHWNPYQLKPVRSG